MDAKDVLEQLTTQDIISILSSFGSSHKTDTNCIKFQTVCHKGSSYKLYYYLKTKKFYCYTHCNSIGNLYELIIKILDCSFKEAFNYVLDYFGINTKSCTITNGFEELEESFTPSSVPLEEIEAPILEPIKNQSICNMFLSFYCPEWLKDNITKDTMDLYNIKYCLQQHKIIIPHFNIKNKIVGVRARSLDKLEAETFGKYIPYNINGTMLSHPLGSNLYGLNINKKAIKKHKKAIIVEGEKGVLQAHGYLNKNNITVAVCGSKLHRQQAKMLLDLGVEEIIIALDKQYKDFKDTEANDWFNKTMRNIEELLDHVKVSIIWDFKNLLKYKDSPTDLGAEIFNKLLKDRVTIDKALIVKSMSTYDYSLFKLLGRK